MTIQYLGSAAGTPTAFFGDRYLTLTDPDNQRILGLFGSPDGTNSPTAPTPLGINGQPGQIYAVPTGMQFIAYQWKYNASARSIVADADKRHRVELGATTDGTFGPLAAINPNHYPVYYDASGTTSLIGSYWEETNAIAVLFSETQTPQVRLVNPDTGNIPAYFRSIEVYGIESPKGTPA